LAKAPKQIEFKRHRGRHLVRIGPREFETRGLADSFWTDLYHRSMIVSWPTFFGTAAAIFVIFNAVFAFLAVANGFAGRELVRMGPASENLATSISRMSRGSAQRQAARAR